MWNVIPNCARDAKHFTIWNYALNTPLIISKIERWWRELHERMNKYFKVFLSWLKIDGRYDPYNETGR